MLTTVGSCQVGTLNYMAPEAILGGTGSNIRGAPPMKVAPPTAAACVCSHLECCLEGDICIISVQCMQLILALRLDVNHQPGTATIKSMPRIEDLSGSKEVVQKILRKYLTQLAVQRKANVQPPYTAAQGALACNRKSDTFRPSAVAGGKAIRHLEPGLHPIPDGVRPHALCGSALPAEDAHDHRPQPRHRVPSRQRCRHRGRHEALPHLQRPAAHHHAGTHAGTCGSFSSVCMHVIRMQRSGAGCAGCKHSVSSCQLHLDA